MADARRAVAECLERHSTPTHPTQGALFLVAVSGGADSLALAWAAQFVLPRAGFRVEAVIVDHGLQERSAEVARQAQTTLEQLGVPASIVAVDLDEGGNVEQRAREARYEALRDAAHTRGAHAVLLGHTLDDQAETVLMGLARGSGPASIHGMDEVSGLWWRPFLGITRQTTRQTCVDAGLSWWDDPHNTDTRFLRPRIRHDVVPLLEDTMGPGVAEALVRTAQLIRQDNEVLDTLAKKAVWALGDGAELGMLPVDRIAGEPAAIASRVIRWVAGESIGASLSAAHTEQVLRLVTDWKGQGPIDIPGGRVVREDALLRFIPDSGRYQREEQD